MIKQAYGTDRDTILEVEKETPGCHGLTNAHTVLFVPEIHHIYAAHFVQHLINRNRFGFLDH